MDEQRNEVVVPEALLELVDEKKPSVYAAKLVDLFIGDIMSALNYSQITNPRGMMTPESFVAAVKLDVATNERVARAMMAAPGSFAKAILLAAQCKLLVGGSYDLFYLIPRWSKRLGCEEITPLIGYKGLCELAMRHPRVHKVEANLVFDGESFDYDAGAGKLTHKVNILGERTEEKMIGGYARVVITDPAGTHPVLDDPVIHVMSRAQLMAVKESADSYRQGEKAIKNGRKAYDPWHEHPLPMHRKSLLRAVLNGGSVPRDMGLGGAISEDDRAQMAPASETPQIPKATTQDQIRAQLGVEKPPEPFATVEDAIAALEACKTQEEARALRGRWDHFQGDDAGRLSSTWDEVMFNLE